MPGFDRTGPSGQGPRTGRGMGNCAGGPSPYGSDISYGAGRGGIPWGGGRGRAWGGGRGRFGGGRGFGGRRGGGYYPPAYPVAPIAPTDERVWLEATMSDLQAELDSIKKRLDEIGQSEE